MADNTGVLIIAERDATGVSPVTLELLGAARTLASALGEGVSAALLGSGLGDQAKELIASGADKVYVVDDAMLAEYQSDVYVAAAAKVCAQAEPRIVLLGQTMTGRDLAPRLAFRLQAGLATDCIGLEIDAEKKLQALRPAYGGAAHAVVGFTSVPQMASIRAKAFEAAARDAGRSGDVIAVVLGMADSDNKTRYMERVKIAAEGVRLEDAPVVVCGGRGVGGAEPYQKELKELADLFKGAVGATKAAVDSGWASMAVQIGLTSKFVSPDIYFAVGLSGAIQHMAGCSGSKVIIAINKDEKADVFRYARYGIVADWKVAVPALIGQVKQLQGS